MALDDRSSSKVQLHNIQRSGSLDLRKCIIAGLQSTPKTMPSLLLWDDQGLRNYEAWTNDPTYYPKRCEWDILRNYATDMAGQLPTKSAIIELGCGSLSKTAWLLSNMAKKHRHVVYYALDVSGDALYTNLRDLEEQLAASHYVQISGLRGTYSDCVEWLANSPPLPVSTVTFLWLGNSIANMTQDDASALMGQLRAACAKMSVDCNFLISADGCQIENRILKAYNPTNGPSKVFLFNGLHHANRLLGPVTFKEEEWAAIPEWNKEENELRYYYAPKRDIQLKIGELSIGVKKEEMIYYFMSGKWSETQMSSIASRAGLSIGKIWKDVHYEYGFYHLQSSTKSPPSVGRSVSTERSLL
ncbi:histidine-specific methyltransferase [Daldinia loculata]|nr:histidine-specific methyltransferase [Daldinia loculata]